MRIRLLTAFTFFSMLFIGCAGSIKPFVYPNVDLHNYKTAFIIANEYSTYKDKKVQKMANIPTALKKELEKYGLNCIIGSNSDLIPDTVDIIVKYEDYWKWDITYFLYLLVVRIVENNSYRLLAEAEYKVDHFHDYPDVDKEVSRMIIKLFDQ